RWRQGWWPASGPLLPCSPPSRGSGSPTRALDADSSSHPPAASRRRRCPRTVARTGRASNGHLSARHIALGNVARERGGMRANGALIPSRHLFPPGGPGAPPPLLKRRPAWAPVLSAINFDVTDGRLHRRRSAGDDFRGCVYFADVRDKDIERHNLGVLA